MYKDGWGVAVNPVWGWDEENDVETGISDIDVTVVRLAPVNEVIFAGALCCRGDDGELYPVDRFREVTDEANSDTHDLRERWYARETDARAHAAYTLDRWEHPAPWESFVQL